jgi:hypothetical protein
MLSLVTFTETVPAGYTFVGDSLGECTAAAGTVTCFHGHLPSGTTVSNTLVYQTPSLPAGATQTSTFSSRWCWDGCFSHSPGAARVDSVDLSEDTTVTAASGFDSTFLLAGTSVDLVTATTTSASDPIEGSWTIPGQATDLAGTATHTPNPPGFQSCPPDGSLCRSGDWFRVLSPGTESFNPYSIVVYTQDKSLIPPGTTEANYQVVYTPCLPGEDPSNPAGCPAVRLPRCMSPSDRRCTESVTELPDGSFQVRVRIGSHNGFMK